MIHGVLPSWRNDAQNKRLSDSSDAIEKQSLYLNWGCVQLWLICSKFSSRNVTRHLDQYRQTLSFNSCHGDPDSQGVLGMMSVLLVMDARWSAGSILTLIAQDDSCCPAEKCPQSTMGHHGPTLGSGEKKLVARSSDHRKVFTADQVISRPR